VAQFLSGEWLNFRPLRPIEIGHRCANGLLLQFADCLWTSQEEAQEIGIELLSFEPKEHAAGAT